MIKTIRANNGGFANFASVQVQPLAAQDNASEVQQQTTFLRHPASPGVVPVRDAAVSYPVMMHTADDVQAIHKVSLSSLVDQVPDRRFVFPVQTQFNNIVPTHALSLDAGKVYDPRLLLGIAATVSRLQPFEQLTGIAHERPEVVMLTSFQPLFDRDASHTAPHFVNRLEDAGLYQFMTDAGRYLDAQSHLRNLRIWNVHYSLRSLRNRYLDINQTFQSRTDSFSQAVTRLKDDASFMLNLVRIIESQKHQLDLRHDLYLVDPHETANYIVQNFSQLRKSISPDDAPSLLSMLVEVGHRPRYDCVDALVDVGFTPDSVKNVFSSSKIWLQILAELKSVLQHHSLRFLDIDPTYQRNDKNASTILQPPTRYFGLATNLPQLPTLDALSSLQVTDASQTISKLKTAFTSIYQNVFFKNEEARIAALAHLVSREYRYSYGLSLPSVQRVLSDFYGFVPGAVSNQTVFDSVIGRFGNNITDIPSTASPTLASVAQDRVSNQLGVLTFETKYVEGDPGILTPGGDYYFDRVLDTDGSAFNTSAIDELATRLQTQLDQLNIVADGFNLLSLPSHPDRSKFGSSRDTEGEFLASSHDTIWELTSKLINNDGKALPDVVDDRLGAVYSQARKDDAVKTILFLYTLSRISRSYATNVPFFASNPKGDNTPLVDYLIDRLVNALVASVPESRTTIQLVTQRGLDQGLNTASLTQDSIRHALKSGTQMTSIIERFMSSVISQFRVGSTAIQNNVSRYGGYLDTIIMMVAFDFAISTVARYSNQSLVGLHQGLTPFSQGQVTFVVSQTTNDHQTSFNELLQRDVGESNLTRQLLMTVLNALQKLGGSLKGISNYLSSKDAVDKLHEIAAVVHNNPSTLKMMFSEQQIMLLASTVDSLVTANSNGSLDGSQSARTPKHQSYHADGAEPSAEVTILDESDVPPAMHDALLGYFGVGDLASQQATNKHVMTVGIPLGFTQRLKQKVNIRDQKRATFENKRNDIVQVTVYKVDLQNADIIYKPVKHLFELSRFPVRYSTASWLSIPQSPSINDIINAIPTQNMTQNPDAGTASSISSGIEYASTAVADSDGVKGSHAAFDDQSYAFLTARQKAEILHNHVASQLLESYIKLMTGINVSEYNYHMVEPPAPMESSFVKILTDRAVAHMADQISVQRSTLMSQESQPPSGGVLFSTTAGRPLSAVQGSLGNKAITHPVLSNPMGVPGQVSDSALFRHVQPSSPPVKSLQQQQATGNVAANLDVFSQRHVPLVMAHLQTISGFSHTLSSMSDVDALNERVLSPKVFDRVFNVIIDARDFEVDVDKTLKTPYGRQALDLMIRNGDIVPSEYDSTTLYSKRLRRNGIANLTTVDVSLEGRSFPQGRRPGNVNSYRYRDRDKNQGDLVADKYFVTIETFGEDEV